MARVKDDVDKIWNAMGYVGMLVVEVAIHVSMVLYCMFSLNWKLALPSHLQYSLVCGTTAVVMEQEVGWDRGMTRKMQCSRRWRRTWQACGQ